MRFQQRRVRKVFSDRFGQRGTIARRDDISGNSLGDQVGIGPCIAATTGEPTPSPRAASAQSLHCVTAPRRARGADTTALCQALRQAGRCGSSDVLQRYGVRDRGRKPDARPSRGRSPPPSSPGIPAAARSWRRRTGRCPSGGGPGRSSLWRACPGRPAAENASSRFCAG